MRGRKPFDAAGWLTSNPLRALVATEGTGLEPVRACAQRFSRPPPYQLGLALPTMLRLNLQRRVLPEESRCLPLRSEEHTSELQSHSDLVCRLLLEKKKREDS